MSAYVLRERPILFSGPMVLAILEGQKTQTRRLFKPQPEVDCPHSRGRLVLKPVETATGVRYNVRTQVEFRAERTLIVNIDRLYFKYLKRPAEPEDTLWVRETWRPVRRDGGKVLIRYRADGHEAWKVGEWTDKDGEPRELTERWRPGIHMPRWASRLELPVTDVRAEQLQDITRSDIRAEGVRVVDVGDYKDVLLDAWIALWDSINGKRGPWAENPWVHVITFGRAP